MHDSRKVYLAIFGLTLILSSCATSPGHGYAGQDSDIVLTSAEYTSATQEASKLWAKRNEASELLDFTLVNQKIVRSSRSTLADELAEARAYYLLGEYYSHSRFETENNFVQAAHWAFQALSRNTDFKTRAGNDPPRPELALDALTVKDAEALYWLTAAQAKTASDQELKSHIATMMNRVAALNPNINFGGPNRYYGIYYSSLADATQADLKISLEQFEQALKRAPEYFENHVSLVRFYASKGIDHTLAHQHLQYVLLSNGKRIKDFYPEQQLEKARAKILWSEGNYESRE